MTGDVVRRWTGNGYLPGRFGLWGFNGLVVAELAGTRFTVRVRPRFLGRLLGVIPLTAEPGNGLSATTARVRLGLVGSYTSSCLAARSTHS